MADLRTYSTARLHAEVANVGLDVEIEDAVLRAIEAGQGPIPSASGRREIDEPVTLAITEALDDDDCMAMLMAHLRSEAGRCLRETIARRWAENMEDGIREAREERANDIASDMFAGTF